MIGRLSGILLEAKPPIILLDVNGVGYEVEAPMTAFYQIPLPGEPLTLHIHMVVRDDAHLLFGFRNESERATFRSLIRVNGVGARLALAILSSISAKELIYCVNHNDHTLLTRVPGIGRKTAERLVIELRDRLHDIANHDMSASSNNHELLASSNSEQISDAITALVALGYKQNDAQQMIKEVDATDLSSAEIIRYALQLAMKAKA
ncbi:MAG: Holliday junction branch migration protein RuvA [Gammaproteobacteria bacterium]|nr:Holliday junction branch migration protein RuvA [Gammaproteobacteria bacterium]